MAYLGNSPDVQQYALTVERFSGTSACTEFTLTRDVDDANYIEVLVNNVQQDPNNSYTVTNGVITFSEAPSTGTDNIIVLYRYTSIFTRTQIATDDLLASAVTTAKIADGSITADKIADGTIIAADIAANAVTTSELANDAVQANNILNGAVTTAKIDTAAVTGDKIGLTAINANNIVDGTITNDKLATPFSTGKAIDMSIVFS
jgi:Arc/MetJ family transcription regulator